MLSTSLRKFYSWLQRRQVQLSLYQRLCFLNKELQEEVERRVRAEIELSNCNRVLMNHNAKLRELIQKQVWLKDTSEMLGELNQMVNDMRGMMDVAATSYEKPDADSISG